MSTVCEQLDQATVREQQLVAETTRVEGLLRKAQEDGVKAEATLAGLPAGSEQHADAQALVTMHASLREQYRKELAKLAFAKTQNQYSLRNLRGATEDATQLVHPEWQATRLRSRRPKRCAKRR